MLNEEDKKALNEFGKRRFFWKRKLKLYSQVADTLNLELLDNLDKEIKQYDDMRLFSKFFFKKLVLFLFSNIKKKRKLLCYSMLKKYVDDKNNATVFLEKLRDLLTYHSPKLGFFARLLKQLTNRLLAMKENKISFFEEKPIESNTENENKQATGTVKEEIIEDLDVRQKSSEESNNTVSSILIASDLLNAVSTEAKTEIIKFSQFLDESNYRIQDLETGTEENKQEINTLKDTVNTEREERKNEKEEAAKKIESLENAIAKEREQRQKEKVENDKKMKEEEEKRQKEKEEAEKIIKDLEENMENKMKNMLMSFMQTQQLPQFNSNMNNNVESSSNPPANNGPGFFK